MKPYPSWISQYWEDPIPNLPIPSTAIVGYKLRGIRRYRGMHVPELYVHCQIHGYRARISETMAGSAVYFCVRKVGETTKLRTSKQGGIPLN